MGEDDDEILPQNPRLIKGQLGNGFRYICIPNKTPKERFIANLIVFSGSADEADEELGLAHYLEHCVFLGTERYRTSGDVDTLLSAMGCSPHADSNAATDFTSTIFSLSASSDAGVSWQRASGRRDEDKMMARPGHKSCGGRISDRIADRLRVVEPTAPRLIHASVAGETGDDNHYKDDDGPCQPRPCLGSQAVAWVRAEL